MADLLQQYHYHSRQQYYYQAAQRQYHLQLQLQEYCPHDVPEHQLRPTGGGTNGKKSVERTLMAVHPPSCGL